MLYLKLFCYLTSETDFIIKATNLLIFYNLPSLHKNVFVLFKRAFQNALYFHLCLALQKHKWVGVNAGAVVTVTAVK